MDHPVLKGIQGGKVPESGRRKILLAVPCLDAFVSAPLALWIASLMLRSRIDPSFPLFAVHFEPSVQPVEFARNKLVGAFFQSGCDALLFVDDDMIPSESSALMFQSSADMVAGRATGFSMVGDLPKILIAAFQGETAEGHVKRPRDLHTRQLVDGAGTGCLLINKHVLEDRRLWGPEEYTDVMGVVQQLPTPGDPDYAPPIFSPARKPNGQWMRGEDIDFTYRATKLGYRLEWVPQAIFGHIKPVDLNAIEVIMDRSYQGAVHSFADWIGRGNSPSAEAFLHAVAQGELMPPVEETG